MRQLSRFLCVLVSLCGATVLAGWMFEIDQLTRVSPGLVTMKVSTACCFLLGGIMGYLMHHRNSIHWRLMVVSCLAWSMIGLMAITLYSSVTGKVIGIAIAGDDGMLSVAPGTPSIGTMIAFIMYGFFGLMYTLGVQYSYILPHAVGIIGTTALAGYAFGVPEWYFYFPDESTAMAVHTAACFLLLGIASVIKPVPNVEH